MLYPERLLPQPSYKYIDFNLFISRSYFLIRHTDSQPITNEEGRLNSKVIVLQTDHLRDFSTNLLGDFAPSDICWSWIGETVCKELWQAGEVGVTPTLGIDVELAEGRGRFYMAVYLFHDVSFPIEDGADIITCRVVHTPTNSNFWHCSLRWWLGNNEEDVEQWGSDRQAIKRRRKILSTARNFIATNAVLDEPLYQSVSPEAYKI